MFKTILICSDGSDCAVAAARAAAQFARAFGSTLLLLSVYADWPMLSEGLGAPQVIPDASILLELRDGFHQAVEDRTLPALMEAGHRVETLRDIGSIVDRIIATADERSADLVVVGSRGLTPWKALLIGSVAAGVLHHCALPVLVARSEPAVPKQILLASDASSNCEHAAQLAVEMAEKFHSKLTVLHVLDERHGLKVPLLHEEAVQTGDNTMARIRAVMDQIAQSHSTPYVAREATGHPAEQIVEFARTESIPLIVIGSRGLGALEGALLGSTSDQVANHAPCSVLVGR